MQSQESPQTERRTQSADRDVAASSSVRGFWNLAVWQKPQDMAVSVVHLVSRLPRNRASDAIGIQLIRAAGSVSANVAEGYGRYSEAAYRNHLSIARGSLFETESWIDLLRRSGSLADESATSLVADCEEVARLLTSSMKPLRPARASAVVSKGPHRE